MLHSKSIFSKSTVELDGNAFDGCLFDQCQLVYSGGPPPSLVSCTFKGVTWSFSGAAANMLQFLSALYRGAGEGGQQFVESILQSVRDGQLFVSPSGMPTAGANPAPAGVYPPPPLQR